jgi:aminoglycoside phosphotransferase (APT) family kinase protein
LREYAVDKNMDEITANQSSDHEGQDNIESIAASIFSRHGIDFAAVQRAGGWTNAVWMTDELVLRLSVHKERNNLLHEARLAAFFPAEVGYPPLVETGITAGHAWTLAQKLPGKSLGEIWADLHCDERVIALQGLWARAQAVHSVPGVEIASLVSSRAWFNSTDPEEADASLRRLTEEGIFTEAEAFVLQDALAHFWAVLPSAPCVLCHGDLTLDNAVWHAGQVTALLDFEFAVMAPVQLDLNHLVKKAFGPDDAATDAHAAQPLRQAVKELAWPILAQPSSKVLLVGYAILLELHRLEEWLAHPEGEGPLEQWDPLRRLRLLADGRRGYLAPLFLG